MPTATIRRPKTVPDLLAYRNSMVPVTEGLPRHPPKLLLKVTVLGSLGPVQILLKPESTVGDLVDAAVRQYVKEGRRPILPSNVASVWNLSRQTLGNGRLRRPVIGHERIEAYENAGIGRNGFDESFKGCHLQGGIQLDDLIVDPFIDGRAEFDEHGVPAHRAVGRNAAGRCGRVL